MAGDVLDDLRKRLKLKPGVVLSDEEIALALQKVPESKRMRAEADVDNRAYDIGQRRIERRRRPFGGLK